MGVVVALFAIVVFFCLVGTNTKAENTATISEGIFVENISLAGKTIEEARATIEDYVQGISKKELTINIQDDVSMTVTAEECGLAWANQEILEEAFALGKKGNLIKRYKEREDLKNENKVYSLSFSVNNELIEAFLQDESAICNTEPINFGITRENGEIEILKGQNGYQLQVLETASLIETYLTSEWTRENGNIAAVVEVLEAKGNEELLLKMTDVLGWYRTSFATSASNRSANVINGCRKIDGTLLYPGESLSVYEACSPFDAGNGYYVAGAYLNGLVVDSVGGGICQVTSTLYNAVLRAELDVTERHNHSMVVPYVPLAADAAISGVSKDLKFTNTLDNPIYIEGTITSNKKIAFTIYGIETRPTNREVVFESEKLTENIPTTERIIQDGAQGIGFLDIQGVHYGYTAKLWKIVKEDGVVISKTLVNESAYMASPRTLTVGVATADPNAAAQMAAAIASGSIDVVVGVANALASGLALAQ